MKITIITATYNSEKTICECIESVNTQTYKNIEHIIIDGASKDNTLQIIKNRCSRISKIISEPDNGIYDALNKGLLLATGNVIGFLNSDDFYASDKTLEIIANILYNDKTDGFFGDLQYVSHKNIYKVIRFWGSTPFERKSLSSGWMPAHPTLYLRREVYKKHGNFDTSLKIAADYDFILRVFKDDSLNFEYLPHVIVKMRTGGISNSSLKNIILKSKEDLRVIKKHKLKGFYTLTLKNFRKILQFIIKR